jgi:hypothetical protein
MFEVQNEKATQELTRIADILKEAVEWLKSNQITLPYWFGGPVPAPVVPQPYYPTWISEIPGIPLGGLHTDLTVPEPCHQLSFSYEEPQLREQLLHPLQTHLNTANTEEQNQTWETPMANG